MTRTAPQHNAGYGWRESYVGGSLTQENELNRGLADRIQTVQARIARRARAEGPRRAQHAKLLVGVTNAEFRVCADVPEDLRGEFFAPGTTHPAVVRFSNCSGETRPDPEPDLRGVGLRVHSPAGDQDFLATNAPASHARTPQQFVIVAEALSLARPLMIPHLLVGLGVRETIRVLRVLRASTARPVGSLATETFWGRCPIAFAGCGVKYRLRPTCGTAANPAGEGDYLAAELVQRLRQGPVTFDFEIQRFVDEQATPIEDVLVPWDEHVAPPQRLAELVIPQQDLDGPTGREAAETAERLNFNPWHCVAGFRPIGQMSRVRRRVYEASVAGRTAGFP